MSDPLAGVRVLDATDASGAYCGRLLADLGADVVRIEPPAEQAPGGDGPRAREPAVQTAAGERLSCFDHFVNLNKRSVTLDVTTAGGRRLLRALTSGADVLLGTHESGDGGCHLLARDLAGANPALIHVCISAFGCDGPYSSYASDDLTTLAAGGLLSLGGYRDSPPIAVHGQQTFFARAIFAAAAVLLALIDRDANGGPHHVQVCAQEAIANALEDALPEFDLTGRVRRRLGDRQREAGTGTFRCADGYITMVTGRLGTTKAWAALVRWMIECQVEGATELAEDRWSDHLYRQGDEGIRIFTETFERFAATRTKTFLYAGAQQRKIPLAPVNSVAEVLDDPQLRARGFFEQVEDPATGTRLTYPGRPYRIDGLGPFLRRPVPRAGQHNHEVFGRELGLDPAEVSALQSGLS